MGRRTQKGKKKKTRGGHPAPSVFPRIQTPPYRHGCCSRGRSEARVGGLSSSNGLLDLDQQLPFRRLTIGIDEVNKSVTLP